jgi:hypothetical protein
MKITIDLADAQFQSTIASAVKERVHALAADELETQMRAAVQTVAATLDKRLEAVIKNIAEEGMNLKGWNSRDTLRYMLERQAEKILRDIVVEQFNKIFPRTESKVNEQ